MQSSAHATLMQFANVLQETLFPALTEQFGAMSPRARLFVAACVKIPFSRFIPCGRWKGRPARYRLAMARAFLAKSIYGLKTTRHLLEYLKVDAHLRQLCGWQNVQQLPHESTFSRAFAEFAQSELGQFAHEALIQSMQSQRLIGHIARDSTAIEARERYPDDPRKKRRHSSKPRKHRPAPSRLPAQATRRDGEQMSRELPVKCSLGVKQSSAGHMKYWRGYKLHLDVADGQIPITALLTSANLHDSQAAIPLMHITSSRVTYLYELMDSAYDADLIRQVSTELNHVAIIDTKSPPRISQLPCRIKKKAEMSPAQKLRFRERTTAERVNARLKDEFGASHIYVRGGKKVAAHLMFAVLALTVDQLLRLAG
jgi:hypothetical protein